MEMNGELGGTTPGAAGAGYCGVARVVEAVKRKDRIAINVAWSIRIAVLENRGGQSIPGRTQRKEVRDTNVQSGLIRSGCIIDGATGAEHRLGRNLPGYT